MGEIQIREEDENLKPKNFLKKKLNLPFFKIVKLIKDKRITLNKKKIKKEDVLKKGDILKIWDESIKIFEKKKNFTKQKNLKIETIFENEDFLVLNKPANIVVQGSQNKDISISLHLAWLKNQKKQDTDFEYFHTHRLDKDTSGVLIIAKNIVALREFNKLFREKEVKKKYICLTFNKLEKSEGKIELFLKRNEEGSSKKMFVEKVKNNQTKKSISLYKVLENFTHKNQDFSLVEVDIKTGITHQIRVHMTYLNCPIVLDNMYGNSILNKLYEKDLQRQFLHAKEIQFTFKNKKYNFKANIPNDLKNFLNKIKE